MALLREALRRLFLVSALSLPPGISTDADITAVIDAQKQAAEEEGKAPAVTAARSTRRRRVQELKDVDRMQLGRGSGAGFPVHTEGRELIGRMNRTTPGVFLDSGHPGVKNAGGTLGSDAQSEGESEDESDDEPEDDESEDEADDPDPCPDNLTFLAGELADPDPCPDNLTSSLLFPRSSALRLGVGGAKSMPAGVGLACVGSPPPPPPLSEVPMTPHMQACSWSTF